MAYHKKLTTQVKERLDSLTAFGCSKRDDKALKAADGRPLNTAKIYSHSTLMTYQKHCNYFVKYCHKEHKCKTLEQCRQYVDEWLQRDPELSPWTLKLEAAALGKLYQCPITEFVETPSRKRADISRSRLPAKRDAHFSETKNAELVAFCRATGLRRHELESLTGGALMAADEQGVYHLHVKGKGGRWRDAPIVGSPDVIQAVVSRCEAAGNNGLVWGKVNSSADIHGYRAQYAAICYQQWARPIDSIEATYKRSKGVYATRDVYTCRCDRKGVVYDRSALQRVSEALGHSRVDVVATNYLHNLAQQDTAP